MISILKGKEHLAPRPHLKDISRGLIGGTLSILALLILGKYSHNIFIMAPFGASCVILYAVSQSPLAQPRNVIFGHLISAFVGLFFLKVCGASLLSIAFAVGFAIALMQYFRCVHPPAGANPLVILLTANTIHYEWSFLLFPVLMGSITLVLIAYIVNNIGQTQKWPNYGLAVLHSKKSDPP